MSNLYKQWFVRAENETARVINSDALMKQYTAKKAQKIPRQVDSDGFAAGLPAEEVLYEDPVDTQEAAAAAREEAERVLAEAKENADRMLAEAQAQAQTIRETAKQQGIDDGQAWLTEENSRRTQQLEQEYGARKAELESVYQDKREHMEAELVDVILEVFNKVFHIQYDNKKDILLHLIDNAILNIEGEKKFRIKVAEENAAFLESHKNEILERVGHDVELEILSDFTMDGNNCTIETDSGVFDCSLGVQLENLIKDIRSLCS